RLLPPVRVRGAPRLVVAAQRELLAALELGVADRARVPQVAELRDLRRGRAHHVRLNRVVAPRVGKLEQALASKREHSQRDESAEEKDAPPRPKRVSAAPENKEEIQGPHDAPD